MSATCLATIAGGYNGRSRIDEPITAVSDCADSRASATITSGVGFGEATCPPTHNDSMPRSSSARTSSAVDGAVTPKRTSGDASSARGLFCGAVGDGDAVMAPSRRGSVTCDSYAESCLVPAAAA